MNTSKNTKVTVEEYELLRASGFCKMLDYKHVMCLADEYRLGELADLTAEEYGYLIANYTQLMEEYNVERL